MLTNVNQTAKVGVGVPGQRGRRSRALRGGDGGGAQHGGPGGGAGGGKFRRRPAGFHRAKLHLPGGRSLVSLKKTMPIFYGHGPL